MGRNIIVQGPSGGSGGGSAPGPEKGEVTKTCKQAPDVWLVDDHTPEERAKMKEENSSPTKYYAPGAGPFTVWHSIEHQEEKTTTGPGGQPTGSGGAPPGEQNVRGQQQPRVRGELDDNYKKIAGNTFVTTVASKLNKQITRTKVKLKDPKADALRRKVREEYEDLPADEIVLDLASKYLPGVNVQFVDDFSTTIIDKVQFTEVFTSTALNRTALLANAEWHIDENQNLWFYQPANYFNNEPVTTQMGMPGTFDPAFIAPPTGATQPMVPRDQVTPPIKAGTAEVTIDGDEIKNVIQIFGGKEEVDRLEFPTGNEDEYHMSYDAVPEETDVYWQVWPQADPPPDINLPVLEDWLDRDNVDPRDAPQYTGPTLDPDVQDYIAWLNPEQNIIRFTTSDAALTPVSPASLGWMVRAEYKYYQTQYMILQDADSIAQFGRHEVWMMTPAGHSTTEMRAIGEAVLREYSQPRTTVTCTVFRDAWNLGQTARVYIPEQDFDQELPIWKQVYRWDMHNKKRYWPGETELHLGKKPQTLDQFLGQFLEDRIHDLEEPYMIQSVPTIDIAVYRETIDIRETVSFSFILGGPYGIIDSGQIDVDRTF